MSEKLNGIPADIHHTFCSSPDTMPTNLQFTLKYIIFPEQTTEINDYIFQKIKLQENITYFGVKSFHHCSSLIIIKLPNSIPSISEKVFSYCSSLSAIILLEIYENIY